ncbi:hypothetical protein [Micromonospora avicenniae]|uniref:hypothetical protein n=1 Tax=Micromonospora avicenniae TaxID=1198245 RepID=UPI0033165B34
MFSSLPPRFAQVASLSAKSIGLIYGVLPLDKDLGPAMAHSRFPMLTPGLVARRLWI